MEYQQIAAVGSFPAPSTDPLSRGVLERCGAGTGGLVFGTLLGPETTGPWHASAVFLTGMAAGVWCGTCVSGFLAAPSTRFGSFLRGLVWGVWYGVVV